MTEEDGHDQVLSGLQEDEVESDGCRCGCFCAAHEPECVLLQAGPIVRMMISALLRVHEGDAW